MAAVPPPSLMAGTGRVRGGVPAADDEHLPADLDRAVEPGLAQELQGARRRRGRRRPRPQPASHVLADGEEHGVAAGQVRPADVGAHPDAAADLDAAEVEDLRYLGVEHLFGKVPVRNTAAQHAARAASASKMTLA